MFGVILLIELVFGVLYATNTPRWEAPDEPAQFNYVRHIGETGTLPILEPGDYDQAYLEEIKAAKFPANLSIDGIRYESYEPPLYYLFATPFYLAARTFGLDIVLVLRLLSVALGGLLLWLSSIVFLQVFPANTLIGLGAVGLMAVIPMHIAMSAAINADSLAEVLVAAVLLVSLGRATDKLDDRRFVLLGGVVYGLVLLTSIKIYASGLILVLAEIAFREKETIDAGWKLKVRGLWPGVKGLKTVLFLIGLSAIISAWWFVRNAFLYGGLDIFGLGRHDTVVVGQPTTTEWIARYGLKNVLGDFFIITFKSFWAQFGWMGVLINDRIYVGLFVLTAAIIFGALLWVFRVSRGRSVQSPGNCRSFALLSVWLLVAVADHVLYNLRYFQPQGRYLFPALIPIAALGAVGLYELLNERYARLVFGLLYIGMLGLDYVSLVWFIIPQLRN